MADKKCPRCGLWSTGSALYCDCGYDFENGIITEPNNKLKLLDYLKHPAYFWEFHKLPTLVGAGISITHFIITPFLLASSFASIRYILGLILAAPGFLLSFIFDSFFQSVSMYIDPSILEVIVLQGFSSFVYGIIASALASEIIIFQVAAIFIIILLILFGVFLLIMASQSFA